MLIAARSSLDVAIWFNDRALGDGEYLQPQKLHRLLYLAQAYYTVAYPTQKLMPAVFIIEELGPTEPTVFHALAFGFPPTLEKNPIPQKARDFLDSIWRKFGASKAEQLSKAILAHGPVVDALSKGLGNEISFDAMTKFYGKATETRKDVPSLDKVLRPKVMRSATGKPVNVSLWRPKSLADKGGEG